MIYLDNGATSFHKPLPVIQAVQRTMQTCASPGRGGYLAAVAADREVYRCRETAAGFFDCALEQVVLTTSCTHGLNIAIKSLVSPGQTVVISGFEHNAVRRPLHALGAKIRVAGRKLFDWDDTLQEFEKALQMGADAAVFTHVSNVFGYILPVEQMAALCRRYRVPFIIDAAQSAGILPVRFAQLGADYIAMPGHKGLLGPQGTGLLLCDHVPQPLFHGGTGSNSVSLTMPDFLPDAAEAGTMNVPGIAGLQAGISYLEQVGIQRIAQLERHEAQVCVEGLQALGLQVFRGEHQSGTVSFVTRDCEDFAAALAGKGIAVRAGLHCAPLAHESAGTLDTGTVRVSYGHNATEKQTQCFLKTVKQLLKM